MNIELPADLAEAMADAAGIYGGCPAEVTGGIGSERDPIICPVMGCRICFVDEVERRIRESVENEKKWERAQVIK